MIFDQLKSRERSVMAQYLLEPAVVRLTEKEKERLLAGKELLDRLGFDVEEFGEGTLIVRQVPADVDTEEIRSKLAEKLAVSGRLDAESPEDRVLHTVACKAAIKAGRMSDRKELETVAAEVMSGRIRYCPHGRPVAVELTKSMIDKNFKRI